MVGAVLLVAIVAGGLLAYHRIDDFLKTTTGHGFSPLGEVVQAVWAATKMTRPS
jgi:hypothetical protein